MAAHARNVDPEVIRQALEIVHVGTWVVDVMPDHPLASDVIHFSDEAFRLFGLTPQFGPLRADDVLGRIHEDDRERVRSVMLAIRERPRPFEVRYRALTGDGRERIFQARGAVICDDGGKPSRVVGTCVDVTDSVRAEQTRAEQERRFQTLFEQTAVGMAVADVQGRFLEVNGTFTGMLGYQPGELIGLSFLDITHPDDRVLSRNTVMRGPLEKPVTYEKRYVRKDGGVVWGRVTVSQLHGADGAPSGFVGVVEDITARKTASEALARQTEVLSGVTEHLPVMVARLDTDGRPVYLNREWQRVFGCTLETAPHDPVAAMFPEAGERARAARELAAAAATWVDFEPVTVDGHKVPSSWAVVRLSDGGMLVLGQDLTERRQLQERLSQSQKMEALGQLAGGVAHDFNNVLTIITACATFIQDAAGESGTVAADAREILTACKRASAVTRQLLALSRRQMLEPEVVDVNEVIQLLAKTMSRVIGENIQLEVDLQATQPFANVDRNQFEQVILNLTVNARDAIRDQGTITLSTSNAPDVHGAHQIVVSVADDGVGIDPAILHRIFEPFFTTKPVGKGTGLGLATVLGTVEQSGGRVDVRSTPGVGSVFHVRLPVVAKSSRLGVAEPPTEVSGGGETVLLVEDETPVRAITRRMLVSLGYTVLEARHGRDALEVATQAGHTVDLLITDVVMPEMGGRELADRIRRRWPRLPVLYISGYADDELLRKGILDPGVRLLRKPFSKAELARAVHTLLHTSPADFREIESATASATAAR